ncbi:MAG: hypothetical protein ACD_79C01096G0003 [uncultured bacterium]|nr:MAG: hypothetical protein ACD_79C01096G0003 [uncultured bacterium]
MKVIRLVLFALISFVFLTGCHTLHPSYYQLHSYSSNRNPYHYRESECHCHECTYHSRKHHEYDRDDSRDSHRKKHDNDYDENKDEKKKYPPYVVTDKRKYFNNVE